MRPLSLYCPCRVWIALQALVALASEAAELSLPWEKNFAAAVAKARAENRPILLMLTATWCGPCKVLEAQTLRDPEVLAGLKDFVWVKAYEDQDLNRRFEVGGYPTLVFLDAAGEKTLHKCVGYQPPGPFLRQVLLARTAAGLPLTPRMQALQARAFVADERRIEALATKGDVEALVKYLAPAAQDVLREGNFVVAKVALPSGIKPANVQASIVSGPEIPFRDSGVLPVAIPREESSVTLRVLAPGCALLEQVIHIDDTNAVVLKEIALHRLAAGNAASFKGKVRHADGRVATNAIVRICDWDNTRTGDDGQFSMEKVSPGTFAVRAEAPGGEWQDEVIFEPGQTLEKELVLEPVTTVGIRWALQTTEGSKVLSGQGVRTGEAYFSVAHGRFLLARGAEVPQAYGSDFSFQSKWKDLSAYIEKETLAELTRSNDGAPIFWLFDAAPYPNGLHAETARFDEIRQVNDGAPYDEKTFFKFLRGETVRKGKVYTVRCVRRDCYAKIEITDVTLVPTDSVP